MKNEYIETELRDDKARLIDDIMWAVKEIAGDLMIDNETGDISVDQQVELEDCVVRIAEVLMEIQRSNPMKNEECLAGNHEWHDVSADEEELNRSYCSRCGITTYYDN